MESLRRLSTSFLEHMTSTNHRDVNVLDAQALNLTFMTEQLVVIGTPSTGPTDPKFNVVNVTDLAHFLDTNYSHHFMLLNCNSLHHDEKNVVQDMITAKIDGDGDSLSSVHQLHEQMLEFNWERGDLKAHTPSFDVLFRMCYALDAYLSLDRRNVALVNCPTGKTRSGIVVACYLLFARRSRDPMDALAAFYRKRWQMKSLTTQTLRQKTPPSIQRFLAEFYQLLDRGKPRNDKPMLLKTIVLRKLPVDRQPCVQIYDDYKLVFCTNTREGEEEPVLDWDEENGCFIISWKRGLELDGGFSLLCSFGGNYDHASDMDASSRVLFRYTDSTLFLVPGLVTLRRHDLDLMKRYKHGFDDDEFAVELELHENSTKQPRDLVRMDYSGRPALCQGLIEITKHHVVLPDPNMQSTLMRMGFSETPTTLALQCSRNTPSLALEMLRYNPLSTYSVQETQERAAERVSVEPIRDILLITDTLSNTRLVDEERSAAPAGLQAVAGESSIRSGPKALGIMSTAMDGQRRATVDVQRELGRLNEHLVSNRMSSDNLKKANNDQGSVDASIAVSFANTLKLADAFTLSRPPDEDTKDTFSNKQSAPRSSNDSSEIFAPKSTGNKYTMMLKRGVPFEAVQNCMQRENADPSTLEAVFPSKSTTRDLSSASQANSMRKRRLKDVDEFSIYFRMLRMGCPKEAVRQKVTMDGIDPVILDLGSDAVYDEVKNRITDVETSVRKPSTVVNGKDTVSVVWQVPNLHGRSCAELQENAAVCESLKLKKTGFHGGNARQHTKDDSTKESALDRRRNVPIPDTNEVICDVTPDEDVPLDATRLTGLSVDAVKSKIVSDSVEVHGLDLGTDANVSNLDSSVSVVTARAEPPKRARKKLHWQAISEDRLQNLNLQNTIWEDEDEEVQVDVDMDELEALFFAHQSTGSATKDFLRGSSKALKRKQTVTLFDAKRAMNAAISLARVKLTYCKIAKAIENFDPSGLTIQQLVGINESLPTSDEANLVSRYTGDKEMLGEAEKFALEIAKVERYGRRMECLIFKMSFSSRTAELSTSLSRLQKASEEVKGSRLLKSLLAIVLKLGNTLNGSQEDNGIKGFTVDSLLRLGHTKAVNHKTTVLHYLVRLMKKNHVQVLDFQAELPSIPLAARESFVTIDAEFKKLEKGLTSLMTEQQMLEKQPIETRGPEATIMLMQAAAFDIEARMKMIGDGISRARKEVSSVLDYFGEDPKRNPSEFFTTLASFCTMFQQARDEVDAADEIARRKERLTIRRLNTLRPLPKSSNGATMKMSCQVLERPQTEHTAKERRHLDEPQ